ncbi:ferritin-like domain-containing protein [Croceibacterium xixiisoli]|uniref:ferritin-like domain-containing protein n=1 Tax=Croceibacterium xixiisoli TaxID=1476466 RepID=UPI002E26541C
MPSLSDAIRAALLTGDPRSKVMATRKLVRDWRMGRLAGHGDTPMPDKPAWPDYLELLPPGRMPKRRRGGSEQTRIALWHSLAHIEFVAIDLALDMVGRFGADMAPEFTDDFLAVAADEAMHFALIERKLRALLTHYGALPAHGGLWEAAQLTSEDVAARLALVLEARGLDVTPATRDRVEAQGDRQGARLLQRILDDEIRHVRMGVKHFTKWCEIHQESPADHWKTLVARHFHGTLRPPFNDSARLAAGLSRDFYTPVA